MSHIIAIERFSKVVNDSQTPSERFGEFVEAITRQVNLSAITIGSGSPEGVVTANPGQQYMDNAGSTGSILYIKKTGSSSTGWVLV